MRDDDSAHVLAVDIKFTVNEAAVGTVEIRECLVSANGADMLDGALYEYLYFLRRAGIRWNGAQARQTHAQYDDGKSDDRRNATHIRTFFFGRESTYQRLFNELLTSGDSGAEADVDCPAGAAPSPGTRFR